MTEQRLFPKPLSEREITPFASARQAWFWFVRCQTARFEGARVVADAGEVVRPCDPDDVYNAVMRLKQAGTLQDRHLQVIEYFGRFPHRNSMLGRVSTPEEIAFLRAGGFNP